MTYPSGDGGVHEVVLVYWVPDQDVIRFDIAPKLCEWERSELSSTKGSDWEIPRVVKAGIQGDTNAQISTIWAYDTQANTYY